MDDNLYEWLSSNPSASTALIVVIVFAAIAIVLIYLLAFFQGREISLWPPRIGSKRKLKKSSSKLDSSSPSQRHLNSKLGKENRPLSKGDLISQDINISGEVAGDVVQIGKAENNDSKKH